MFWWPLKVADDSWGIVIISAGSFIWTLQRRKKKELDIFAEFLIQLLQIHKCQFQAIQEKIFTLLPIRVQKKWSYPGLRGLCWSGAEWLDKALVTLIISLSKWPPTVGAPRGPPLPLVGGSPSKFTLRGGGGGGWARRSSMGYADPMLVAVGIPMPPWPTPPMFS